MNAKKSTRFSYWKYAFVAPLLFVLSLILNEPTVAHAAVLLPEKELMEVRSPEILSEDESLSKVSMWRQMPGLLNQKLHPWRIKRSKQTTAENSPGPSG